MTCSNYGVYALKEYGLSGALPRIRERLIQCSEYATDPFKGKISEDDPGPLKIGECSSDPATPGGCLSYFAAEIACVGCLSVFT
jgi:hypothetical protein